MPAKPPRMKDVPRNLKSYFLCLLRKGEKWNEPEGATELMPQHLAFLREQTEAGNFLVSGPVLDDADDIVGITIIEAENAQVAQVLANLDPAATAGRLRMEIRPVFLPALDAVRVQY